MEGFHSPICSTVLYGGTYVVVAQLVECNLAKVDVAGSSPVYRSKEIRTFKAHRELPNNMERHWFQISIGETIDFHVIHIRITYVHLNKVY